MKLKYNTTTLNIRLRSIRAFLNWLAETERIKTTPWNIKQLPVQRKRPIYFTDAEMYKILEAAKDNRELYSRIYVHWKTGLRLREFENSYLENGFITTIDPCKNGIQRDIPADKETAKQYTWLKENSKHIPGTISKMFLELIKDLKLHETKAGDTRHFHCLRHTFAVKTYFQTRDIYRVSKLLGHSTVKTTEIYSCFELSKLEQDFNSETTAKPVLQKALEITLQEVIKAEARRIKPQAHPKPLPKPQTATEPILIPVLDEVYIQKYTA